MSWKALITDAGNELSAKTISGGNIKLTHAKAGSGTVSEQDLHLQTELVNVKQTLSIESIKYSNAVNNIEILLDCRGLKEAYDLAQIGIYATDPDAREILFAIAQTENPKHIPAENEVPFYSIDFNFAFALKNNQNMVATIDQSTFATKEQLSAVDARIDNIIVNAGSTEDNAELIDMRVDVDGKRHSTAGEALRSQLKQKANLTDISSPYQFRGACLSANLPGSGNKINDTYYVTDKKCKFTWNGAAWYQSSLNESDYEEELSSLTEDLVAQNSIHNGGLFDYVYNLLDGREWKHGSWSSSKPTDVSNRIRTGIINIVGLPPIFPVRVQDGYLWNYYAFDGTAVGAGSAWKESGDFNFANAGNPTKISILVKNKDDSEIINIDDVASKISVVFSLFDSFYKDLQMINSGSLADYKNLTGFYGCISSSISNITDLPPNISTGFILRNEQIKNGNIVFGVFQIIQSRYGEIATRFITTSGVADDWTILRTKSIEMVSIGDSIPLGTYSWFDESAQWGHLSAVDTKISYVQKMCNIKGIINRNYCHGGLGWLRTANDETSLKPLLDTIDFTSVNYVYMQLGTNDWNYSFALGETTDAKDTDTVCGHIRYAIEYIYAKNPLIKLCIALPFNRAPGGASYKYNWGYGALNNLSKTLKDYCDAIKTICDEYGVQYIDWTTNSAVGRLNIEKMLPDGTHPSIQAHEILGHELAGRIPFN